MNATARSKQSQTSQFIHLNNASFFSLEGSLPTQNQPERQLQTMAEAVHKTGQA
ncbi:hypothetical protein [Pelagicoccus albus]|uniref:Uncharacterized protein n=1 Tax=Pelagicoccus albus TaxID=415222 RepID=A0A7X1B975_9BACT|nr:hypothetical protein [Pelagicoccus albus]